MHISIDDVKGVFKALSARKLNSIFDTRTLGFLKTMHEKYNAEFDLYCTYTKGEYLFADLIDRYQKEFKENSAWLRFGMHCYSEQEDRGNYLFVDDIDLFLRELNRITGQGKMSQFLRTHRFLGDREYCKALAEKGVSYLLTADDNRISYYLNEESTAILKEKGCWHDNETGIDFIKTAFRLENINNVHEEIMEYRKRKYPIIAIFTHECLMDSIDIRNKMEICCKYSMEV